MVVAFAFVAVSSASAAYMHTVTLKQGSSGSQVMELQKTLGVGADGAFGPMTKAAVMSFQSANGLTADGVVGPMTGAKLAGGSTGCTGFDPMTGKPCGSTSTVPGCMAGYMYSSTTGAKCSGGSTSGPVTGGAGSITLSSLSDFSSEEVGEGEDDVEVMAFEVEADDESDVDITSVKLEFYQDTGADSQDLTDYADSVSVWFDGEMVGEADASDFSEDSDYYSKTISLDGAVVEAGETGEFTVAVTALSNLDSGDIDTDDWSVDLLSVRFEDGEGVVTTESGSASATDGSGTFEKNFDFGSFATSADLELKITEGDDTVNDAHVINIDATDNTDDVEILSFEMEVEGDSDVELDSLPVSITVATQDHVDEMVSGISLWLDGDKVGTVNMTVDGVEDADGVQVGTQETYVFEDLGLTLSAGDTHEFLVKVDIFGLTDTGDVTAGDTILAAFGETQTDLVGFDAQDEAGEDLADADVTGTATSDASEVRDTGVSIVYKSSSAERTFEADAATEDDQGTYKIKFSVTAFDADMYIDRSSEVAGADAAGQGVEFSVTSTAGTPVLGSNLLESSTSMTEDTANVFYVEEGTTREFTLTVIYSADSTPTDGSHSIKIDSINWGVNADNTNANYYIFDLGDYKTDALFLNGIA